MEALMYMGFESSLVASSLLLLIMFFILLASLLGLTERSRNHSASYLHCVLACSMLSFIVLYLLNILGPKWTLLADSSPLAQWLQQFWQALSLLSPVLVLCFCLGMLRLLKHCFYVLSQLRTLKADLKEKGIDADKSQLAVLNAIQKQMSITRPVALFLLPNTASPYTFGLRRPVIVLPSAASHWSYGRLSRVLMHECAHIKRADWFWDLVLSSLSKYLFFVPFMSATYKKVQWFSELACDDEVIKSGEDRLAYAQDLLDVALSAQNNKVPLASCALISINDCFLRIQAVIDPTRVRQNWSYGQLWPLALVWLFLAALASIRFEFTPSANPPINIEVQEFEPEESKNGTAVEMSEPPSSRVIYVVPEAQLPPVLTMKTEATLDGIQTGFKQGASLVNGADEPIHSSLSVDIAESLLHAPLPIYPKKALNKGLEGEVTAQFDIDIYGRPFNIRIIQSKPRRAFDRSVVSTIEQYRYSPCYQSGRAVIVRAKTETFNFQLKRK